MENELEYSRNLSAEREAHAVTKTELAWWKTRYKGMTDQYFEEAVKVLNLNTALGVAEESLATAERDRDAATSKVKNLALLVQRLALRVTKYEPDSKVVKQSFGYIKDQELGGSILRDIEDDSKALQYAPMTFSPKMAYLPQSEVDSLKVDRDRWMAVHERGWSYGDSLLLKPHERFFVRRVFGHAFAFGPTLEAALDAAFEKFPLEAKAGL